MEQIQPANCGPAGRVRQQVNDCLCDVSRQQVVAIFKVVSKGEVITAACSTVFVPIIRAGIL